MGQYGRIGKRRSGSATWQWMMLGFFPGILCGGVIIFAMFASGALNSLTTNSLPTPTGVVIKEVQVVTQVQIVTATPNDEVTAGLPAPTQAAVGPVGTIDPNSVLLPTSTPLVLVPTKGAVVALVETATPQTGGAQSVELTTVAGTNPQPTVVGAVAAAPTSGIPASLQGLISTAVTIPGGTFTMGTTAQEVIQAATDCVKRDGGTCVEAYGADSSPQFQVQLASYKMEDSEVTFKQYIAFLNTLRSQGKTHKDACPSPNGASNLCIQTANENPTDAVVTYDSINYNVSPGLLPYPVYGVTWAGAQAYCEAIGRRLPTETEWEYAAKGIDPGRIYPWGNLWNPANAKTRIPRDVPAGMVPVGSYPGGVTPNGLKDMAGNVEEWVSDWYGETYYSDLANQAQPLVNPTGPVSGTEKVLRGGSWDQLPFFARTVHRRSFFPSPDGNSTTFPRSIGFRCAESVNGAAPAVSNGTVDPSTLGVLT